MLRGEGKGGLVNGSQIPASRVGGGGAVHRDKKHAGKSTFGKKRGTEEL